MTEKQSRRRHNWQPVSTWKFGTISASWHGSPAVHYVPASNRSARACPLLSFTMKHAALASSMVQGGGRGRADGMGLVACVRRAPRPDIYYIDAFIIRASDVRDDVPLAHQATRFAHCILSRADLTRADVAIIDLIPVVNEPRHLLALLVWPFRSFTMSRTIFWVHGAGSGGSSLRLWSEVETYNLSRGIDMPTKYLNRRPLGSLES